MGVAGTTTATGTTMVAVETTTVAAGTTTAMATTTATVAAGTTTAMATTVVATATVVAGTTTAMATTMVARCNKSWEQLAAGRGSHPPGTNPARIKVVSHLCRKSRSL